MELYAFRSIAKDRFRWLFRLVVLKYIRKGVVLYLRGFFPILFAPGARPGVAQAPGVKRRVLLYLAGTSCAGGLFKGAAAPLCFILREKQVCFVSMVRRVEILADRCYGLF